MPTFLQILHGAFGIGGLLGPVVVYLFDYNTMTLVGLIMLITVPFYYYLPSVEMKEKEEGLLDQK